MRYTEPDPQTKAPDTIEEKLRAENRELKRQLEELKGPARSGPARNLWHPSALTIWAIFLVAIVLVVVAFFAGCIWAACHSGGSADGPDPYLPNN